MSKKHRQSGRAGRISFFRSSLDWLLSLGDLFWPGDFTSKSNDRSRRRYRMRFEPLEERNLLTANPMVLSLVATNPPGLTTDASSVSFTATFSSPVTGVDATDFSPVPSASVATTSIQVTPQSSSVYTVTIGGITGTGTLGLNLVDNGSIRDSSDNGLVQSNTPLSLSTQHVISVGASPNSVQVGDLDGDGNADLAVDNFNSATVSVMLGNGNGTFQTRQTYTVGTQPDWLAEADLNGDHKLDLIVANFASNTVSVLLNNGNGTFQTQQTYSTGQHPSSVAIADFDRDGNLDLAVYNAIDKTVSILRGNGNGTFLPQTTFTPGMGGSSLITADFNGDHNPDLAITGASSNGSVVGILLGNGNGTFQPQTSYTTGTNSDWIASADVNGDGFLDLAVTSETTKTVTVFLGNGTGGFQAQPANSTGTMPTGVAIADINGDGKPDLVVDNELDNNVSVLLGNGDGSFQAQQNFTTGTNPTSVAVADFNSDGKPDLAVGNGASSSVSLFLNSANGTFAGQVYTITADHAPQGTNNTVMTLEDTSYTFATADFGFSDPNDSPPNNLAAVKISSLPTAGTLTDNNVAVTLGQFIPLADITTNQLKFTPASNAKGTGYASFTFQVKDDGAASPGVNLDPTPRTMTVNVTSVNDAPQGTSNTVTTLEDIPLVFATTNFGFSDPNDSPPNNFSAVKITTLPVAGTLTDNNVAVTIGQFVPVTDVTANQLKFTPASNANGTGYASFTFQVQDDGGTANSGVNLDPMPRTMTINVTAVNDAPQGTNNTVTTLEDTPFIFATGNFGFSDPNDSPPNNLAAVKITTLPTAGTLTDNNVAITTGQFIPVADVTANQLKFTPASNVNGMGYASFTFQVQDDGGTANSGVNLDPTPRTMMVNVTSVNDAPQGTSNTVTTLEDAAFTFATANFGFSDPNDSPPDNLSAVKITTLPVGGTLTDNNVAVTIGQFVPVTDVTANQLKFTPASNANGTGYASFTFQVQDDGGTVNSGVNMDPTPRTMTINVTSVNDAPQGTSNSVTTLEDTPFTFATGSFGFSDPNDSPANNLAAVEITTLPVAGTLRDNNVPVTAGQFIPVTDVTANQLQFISAANANGTGYASFTFQVQDDGGTDNAGLNLDPTPRTMTIDVTAVNDAPQGTSNSVTTLEDTPFTFATGSFGFSDPNDSPANNLAAVKITTLPTAGILTDNNVAVTTGQFVAMADITGNLLTFTPAANANGAGNASFTFQVQDDGGTDNTGVNLDPTPRTMTINVTSVNDAPQGMNNTVTTLEDTPFTFATGSFGFSDPNDSPANNLAAVEITTLPGPGTLTDDNVAVTVRQFVPVADITGNLLKFTPSSNANGAAYASFTFQVQDDGGTDNAGVNLDPTPRTLTINVTSVNDAPQGTSNSVTTLEDTPFTFATGSFGFSDPNDSPANNLAAVKITTLPTAGTLKDNNVAVTTGQFVPVADITGNLLKFCPAANANGTAYASFTFQVQDDGGTAHSGVNLDPTPRTMTINVTSVNDAPVFTAGPNETVNINSSLQTVPTWATAISAGPPDESGQTLNFIVNNNNSGLFAVQPSISSSGTLTFTPAAGATGSATVQVQLHDNGGTAYGGVDTSAVQTFSIAVQPLTSGYFDFDATSSLATTATGYNSVLASTLYASGLGYGWLNALPTGSFDRGGPNALLRDGNYGGTGTAGARTFQADLANGSYLVNVTMGDAGILRDQMQVTNADTGAALLSNINTPAGQFFEAEVPVTVTDGSLDLQFSDLGGDPYWVVNALEVRPAATVVPVSFTTGPGAVAADGLTTDTINGTAAVPNGTLLTVSSSMGTVVTDSSGVYTGNQVVVNGGAFSFQITRPTAVGTPTLAATAVDGSAQGRSTNSSVLSYQASPSYFDFGATSGSATTATGYKSVLASTLYNAGSGYGWLTVPAGSFDRGGTNLLLRDGNFGGTGTSGARTFQNDLPNGSYLVNVTMGDASILRDQMQLTNADTGAVLLSNINTPAGQFFEAEVPVTVTDGSLDLQFSDLGGDPYWVVNALEIRPAASIVPIAFTTGPGAVAADGLTTDTINGTAAVPNGTILTVSSSMGTVTTDSNGLYTGNQVVVNGGAFSFQLTRPAAGGTPTLTATAVDGSAQGSATNPAVLSYQIAATRRFDFNGPANTTAVGFIGVRGSNLYSANTGFGWTQAAGEFDRGTAAATTVALYEDGNYGSSGPLGARTFEIQVVPGGTYGIRVYVGDASFLRDDIQVSAEGGATVNVPTTGINHFTSVTLTGVDANSNGILTVTLQDNGGSDPNWVIDGMDVALGGVGSLPGGEPLQVLALGPGGAAAGPLLTSQALAPIVQEAIARWQAAGIGSQAVAMLQGVKFQIANLDSTGDLGLATPGLVTIDDNGDGYGWFVDPTPKSDVEFAAKVAATQLQAVAGSAAFGRMDLLTVVMHELGHELGLSDIPTSTNAQALMTESITTGIRRLPPAMTPAMVTPMTVAAPQPQMTAASDTVFAALGTTAGSGTSLNTPAASLNFSTLQVSAIPLRVETNLAALQPTLVTAANSAPISNNAPRKITSSVDAVFNLLGR